MGHTLCGPFIWLAVLYYMALSLFSCKWLANQERILYFVEIWRGGRVVEGARLESVYAGNRIEGSNPSLSASYIS